MNLSLFDAQEAQRTPATLEQLERVIEGGLQTFVEVGLALLEIRERRLYRQQGHATFEDYCRERWQMGQSHAYRLMDAARVAQTLQSSPIGELPATESQARELTPLLRQEPAAIPEVWQAVQEAAAVEERPITAADVREAVQRREAKSHREAHAERLTAYEAQPVIDVPVECPIVQQDALTYLRSLKADGVLVDCAITSPPYWAKRTYSGDACELGQERDPADYVDRLCEIVNALGDVLREGACLFLNLGDTLASQPGQYRGDPNRRRGISNQAILANGTAIADRAFDVAAEKTFCLIPESVIMRLVLDFGWRLAGKVVWHKIGHAPENVYDRLTQAWEPVYVLTRATHAYFRREAEGITDRPTDVWAIPVGRNGEAGGHLAPFPEGLVERALRHACRPGGVVLDPFAGSGTVRQVALRLGYRFLGCDLIPWTEQ